MQLRNTKSLYEYIVNSLVRYRVAAANHISYVGIYGKPEAELDLLIDAYKTHIMLKHMNSSGMWCTTQDIKQYV